MNPSEEVIFALLELFRRTRAGVSGATLELSFKLLAWAKLSKQENFPKELCLTGQKNFSSTDIQSIFKKISELNSLGDNRSAFEENSMIPDILDAKTLGNVLDIVYKFSESTHLDSFEIPESCYYDISRHSWLDIVPSEVSQLIISLTGDLKTKRVYCPYDTACFLARRANIAGAEVYLESHLSSSIPWITNILCNTNIHVKFGDPVRHPSYIKEGRLEKFDITLAFPPINVQYDKEVFTQDWFSRFSKNTLSGSVLQLQHILSQTKEKVIIVVPRNILFGRGAEHILRQELLKHRLIEAIITMPPAILSFTTVQVSILILNPNGGIEKIRFVNGGDEGFYERDGRFRSRLVNWEGLLDAFQQSTDEALALNVPVNDVLKNDSYLEASRYLLTPTQKKINELLKASEVTHLEDLVSLIRPSTKIKGEGDITAYEVSPSDFPDFGYLKTPQRTITLTSNNLQLKDKETFLKPGDIIIVTKGSVGKVAIALNNVPPAGKGGWLVNQVCTILRLSSNKKIEPKTLFMYLRSDLGQTLIQGIISGATVPLIQLRSLGKLQIIIPNFEESKCINQAFDKQLELQQEIETLRQQQYELEKAHWRI